MLIFLDMDDFGTRIFLTQNEDRHLDELKAQRVVYSSAKTLFVIGLIIAVPLPIGISFASKCFKEPLSKVTWIFALYTIIAALAEIFLEKTVKKRKRIAASIQEKFDNSVLSIDRNPALSVWPIDHELIRRYSKKQIEPERVEELKNWYPPSIQRVKSNLASLLCQRANVYYDFSIRHRFNVLLIGLGLFTLLALLVSALLASLTLESFLIQVILPTIPVFILACKEEGKNTESMDNLAILKGLIESRLSNIGLSESVEPCLTRSVQDRIFQNRCSSPLIPDWIYRKLRPAQEDEMNYSIETMIEEIQSRKSR